MQSTGAATFWMNEPAPVEPFRLRAVPMLLAALAFAAGVADARQWHPPLMLTLCTLFLLLFCLWGVARVSRVAWLPVLTFWAAVGCWSAQVQPPAHRPTELHPFADGLSRTVRGRVIGVRSLAQAVRVQGVPNSPAEPWLLEPGAWERDTNDPTLSVDLALEAIEQVTPDSSRMVPIHGGLRATLSGTTSALHCGDLVELPVRLREPEVYQDPGAFAYADWLLRDGVGALATADTRKLQVRGSAQSSIRCYFSGAQQWAAARLEALPRAAPLRALPSSLRFTEEDAGMLAAMLFGDRSQLTAAQRAGFERTGTFHLFVVSGLHITLLTGAVFWILRRLRLPEMPAVLTTIAISLAYALLTGFGVPTQRALAMSSVYLLARAWDRQRSGLNALGVAALAILVADPRALFEASFQMTALVILAVGGLALPLAERLLGSWKSVLRGLETREIDAFLPPFIAERRVLLRMTSDLIVKATGVAWTSHMPRLALVVSLTLLEALLFSVAIELCMALPMAVYFHRFAPLALPGNLLVSPFAILLAAGATVTFIASLLSPWLAAVPAAFTAILLHMVRAIVDRLGQARFGDLRTPSPPFIAVMLCLLLAAFALWALRSPRPVLVWSGAVCILALPLVALWPVKPALHKGQLEITALDVGQGDSLLVVSPEGRTMLVDAGGPVGRVDSKWDVGEQVVAPYLWSRRLHRLDTVVITHGHSDHIGGMPAVLRDLRPHDLWLSLQPGQSAAVRALVQQAKQQGMEVHWLAAGDHLPWGGVTARVLAPERTYSNYGDAVNDDSLVLRLDWQKASVLLEGDAETPSEEAMLVNGRLSPVTVLKVGHHGSRTSTSPAFLDAVAPRSAVISVGQHNTFGHPRWEVLERLEAHHVKTFRTDREGAETLLLSPEGEVTAQRAYN